MFVISVTVKINLGLKCLVQRLFTWHAQRRIWMSGEKPG